VTIADNHQMSGVGHDLETEGISRKRGAGLAPMHGVLDVIVGHCLEVGNEEGNPVDGLPGLRAIIADHRKLSVAVEVRQRTAAVTSDDPSHDQSVEKEHSVINVQRTVPDKSLDLRVHRKIDGT